MTIQQTSLDAYSSLQNNLGLLQRKVLAVIREVGPVSNSMISSYTDIPINIVTPRVYELRQMGYVIKDGTRPCVITGKKVIYWRAVR